jgi:hypothetical protein
MNRFLFAFACLFGALVACSSDSASPQIRASDYDQRCVTSDDCVVITEGPVCVPNGGCPSCPNAAISKSASTREISDATSRRSTCPPTTEAACDACSDTSLNCVDGMCKETSCNGRCDAGTDAGDQDAQKE